MSVIVPKPRRRVVQEEGPDPIDIFVGKRMRERRRQESLSQTTLGDSLGVTFQAVGKYESGDVRISASTLFRLCQVLGVGPAYFFEGYAGAAFEPATKRKRKASR